MDTESVKSYICGSVGLYTVTVDGRETHRECNYVKDYSNTSRQRVELLIFRTTISKTVSGWIHSEVLCSSGSGRMSQGKK